MTARHRLAVLIGLLALFVGASPVLAPPASAAFFGHDISWPQCSTAQGGFGLPLPPPESQFVIIGLTRGLPFTENPCLASQVTWAQTNGKPQHAYTIAAFPTASQLSTYGGGGPWSARTRAGQLSNVGYAQGKFALASMARVGFAAQAVWIDIEPRAAQPWPTSTAAQQRENRYIIEGLMRAIRDGGKTYGLYSFLSGWQSITGSWRVPGVPVWATAGRLDYPNEALDRCTQASFSGGRVLISQWYDDTRDYDRTCGTYDFTPPPIPPSSLSASTAEWNGDWNNDVLARDAANGDLLLYRGTGNGTLLAGVRVGAGWQIFRALETTGDLTGDGASDVLGIESAGNLWLYPGNGRGGFLPRIRAGVGWNVMNALVGVGDLSGDQRPDLLARESATGYLWLYRGNGAGGWQPRVRVGTGWGVMSALVGPGDFTGDGDTDLLARESATGYLWLYPGNGAGGFEPRVRVGTGWNIFSAIMSPGDLNGDRTPDVLARDAAGSLWLYPSNGTGGWLARVQIGTGWNSRNAIF